MIDSFNDGPPLSYACSLLTFSLICIFTIDVYEWARFCNVVFFGGRRNQYTNVGKMFLFLKLIHGKFDLTIHKLTFDRCHKLAQRCDRRRAERNYTRCKYQHILLQLESFKWVRIPRSFTPKLVLISRDHSVNFTVDLSQEALFIYRFHPLIPQKLTISAPTLVTSASHKITAKCGILCPKTLLSTEKQLHAIHFFVATCNVRIFAPWRSHNPVRITKSPITGKSFVVHGSSMTFETGLSWSRISV